MKRYIGNKEFYKLVLALALPMLLQNLVSTFVSLLDNLMVGRIGTESMSGVSIVNQILFVYNLSIFGGTGGAGIFGAQFYGRGDREGVRHTLRFNLILCLVFTALAVVFFFVFPDRLIGAFLHEGGTGGDLALTLAEGKTYLRVMIFGLPAFAFTNAYVSILRVTGDNKLPMRASLTAIGVNLVFNYLLIYGKLGFPRLGVEGAAIATVLSRYVETALILRGVHRKPDSFAKGTYRHFSLPGSLVKDILRRGMPLLVNEALWSLGQTMLTQCYSYRGLEAVAALNINSTVLNLFNTVLITLGNVVGVIIGNLLGAEEFDRAKSYCPKLMFLGVASCTAVGALLILAAPIAPRAYNTTAPVMALASRLMCVCGAVLPLNAVTNICYWTLRAGGRTYITMLFDSAFSWVVSVPLAFVLMHYTPLPLLTAYLIVTAADIIKAVIGIVLLRKGIWIHSFIGGSAGEKEKKSLSDRPVSVE